MNSPRSICRVAVAWWLIASTFAHLHSFRPIQDPIHKLLINNIGQVCPVDLICERTAHLLKSSSCCTACSCSPDCVESGRCCFPTGEVPGAQKRPDYHHCIFTQTTLDQRISEHHTSLWLYMVDTCPTPATNGQNVNCAEDNAAPWGSLFPVYSESTKRLYKNQACARCHDESDVKPWGAFLRCTDYAGTTGDSWSLSNHVEAMYTNSLPDHCYAFFEPPVDMSWTDFELQKCYDDGVIKTCPQTDFIVPDGIDMTAEEIIASCESGFWSPYLKSKRMQNVFCHICNGFIFNGFDMTCDLESDDQKSSNGLGRFSILLRPEIMGMNTRNSHLRNDHYPEACKGTTYSECKRLYCPSGQVFNKDLECEFPYLQEYGRSYNIYVELVPDGDLTTFDIINGLLPNDISLGFSLPTPWEIKHVLATYDTKSSSLLTPVASLIVNYEFVGTVIDITMFMQTIEQAMERSNIWIYKPSNTSNEYKLTARFWKFAKISPPTEFNPTVVPYWKIKVQEENPAIFASMPFQNNTIHILYAVNTNFRWRLLVNRLNFCHQVPLNESEYMMISSVVYHKELQRFFFDNEYVAVTTAGGEQEVRLCMDELGYTRRPKKTSLAVLPSPALHLKLAMCVILAARFLLY